MCQAPKDHNINKKNKLIKKSDMRGTPCLQTKSRNKKSNQRLCIAKSSH